LKQSKLDATCFKKIVVENKLNILQGMAVYPRYYEAGDGETFTDSIGYKTSGESRLVFQMIGNVDQRIVFPMSQPPDFFPDASDVTLLFDINENVWFIFVEQSGVQKMYISETLPPSKCG
jgi:hypothetical protein